MDPAVLSRRFREDGALVRFALEVEAASEPDLLMVLLAGIDRVSHFLWGNVEPPEAYPERLRPSPSAREAGAAALKRYYEYTDALVGAVVERFAPDDLVMIVSDHGFEAGVRLAFLTGEHKSEKAIDGVIFARGRGIPAGRTAGAMTVYDVTPTILAWLGLPVAMDMDGGVAGFVQEATEERIPSYDTGPVERISTAPSGADEVLIEQLRALGYIE
jgi:predicted AlkP superfamily phosphohydrolase/phosphomutase